MRRYLSKALVIALAAIIVGGATVAFAGTEWLGSGNQGASNSNTSGWNDQRAHAKAGGLGIVGLFIRPAARIGGTVSSIDGNTITVNTKRGQVKVTLDGKVRIVEIRTSLEPIGIKQGQHVVLIIGRRTKNGPEIRGIIVRAAKPNNKNADDKDDAGSTQ